MGDSIQLFPLILSLKNHFRKSKLFYLGAHTNHFNGKLKEYNIHLETVDLGLKFFDLDGGIYYLLKEKHCKKITENLI